MNTNWPKAKEKLTSNLGKIYKELVAGSRSLRQWDFQLTDMV